MGGWALESWLLDQEGICAVGHVWASEHSKRASGRVEWVGGLGLHWRH